MKKTILLIFCTVTLFAQQSVENIYKEAFKIATNPDEISKFRDPAHALSDLWGYSSNIPFKLFYEESSIFDWETTKKPEPGNAILFKESEDIYLILGVVKTIQYQEIRIFLDLKTFKVIFSQKRASEYKVIRKKDLIRNASLQRHAVSYAFKSSFGESSHNFTGVLRPKDMVVAKFYPIATIAFTNSEQATIHTTNQQKVVKKFEGKMISGSVCNFFDTNEGEITLDAKIMDSQQNASSNPDALLVLEMVVIERD
ncbi:hypothetical protein [Candidatus Uabimicrobium amorphum]|uniref:Uncharacterized protein n=1 Tax=Uabimicrobium amorphum TaxID=2596890 RepID=A0A5S9IMQ9_UABAM|nr:hypothetical protein [Candidatus Uabimicrobium amorphum]BBM84377.1 hypothetical protein UABAM_02736 [Candidatus Uabimicrobium amorphum]